jgi:hypothetical protein
MGSSVYAAAAGGYHAKCYSRSCLTNKVKDQNGNPAQPWQGKTHARYETALQDALTHDQEKQHG